MCNQYEHNNEHQETDEKNLVSCKNIVLVPQAACKN